MPEAIGAFASWVAEWAATAGAADAAGTYVVTYSATTYAVAYGAAYVAGTIAIGAALGAVARAVAGGAPTGSLNSANPLAMTRSPIAPRRVIYGQTRVSGPLVYAQVTGTKNEYLHLVIALAGHECEEIGDIYFNDVIVPLDGSGNATGTYAGFVRVTKHLGTDTQAADANLVSESGGMWTSAHQLKGIAYVYVRLKYDTSVMPGGIPNVTAIVKGRKVYDPRSSTTAWSANVALCIRDYLTNQTFGLAFDGATEINDASFIARANLCDEAVTLADMTTEPRYTLNGPFDTSSDPATVLNALTAAMAGWVVFVGGQCIIGGGAHDAPTTPTLTESDLRGPISVQTKLSIRDTCNRVKGTFPSPADKWQTADLPEILNSTYLAEDQGIPIWRDLSLGFTTSPTMGQRLEKIELERTRQDIVVTMPCKLTALRVQAGDVVEVSNARFGWTNKLFLVTDMKFSVYSPNGAPALGVDLTLRETASAVWDWSSGEQLDYDPAPNTSLPNPWVVAAPTALTPSIISYQQPDGSFVPAMKLSWTAPAEQFVTSGGAIHVQYKKHADSTWSEAAPVKGDQVFTILLNLLLGTAYDFQIIAINNFGVPSTWAQSLNVTMTDTSTAPGVPTGTSLAAPSSSAIAPASTGSAIIFGTTLSWVNPSDANLDHVEIKATQTNSDGATDYSWSPGGGVGLITVPALPNALGVITLYNPALQAGFVRIRAVNPSGFASAWVLVGNANSYASVPLGNLSLQNSSAAIVTGLQTGGSGARKVLARHMANLVITLTGGATYEDQPVDISGRGFATKPDCGSVEVADSDTVTARYNYDNGSNSSTQAWIKFVRYDGGTLAAGARRVSVEFIEYV